MLRTPVDRRAFLTRIELGAGLSRLPPGVVLAEDLGGRFQLVGGDFAGSSIQFPTRYDLMPGRTASP